MDIQVRAARPTDRGPIADLIHSSGPELYDFLYGLAARSFIAHEFESGRGFAGHPGVTVAVLDGEVVGTGCFYDREQHQQYTRETLRNWVRFFGVRCPPVLLRSRHVPSVIRRPKPGEIYLANFGVAPALRSRGIGSQLVAHGLQQARAREYTLFGLDVSVNNPRGQALYERLGLQLRREKAFSDTSAGVPHARKMELALA